MKQFLVGLFSLLISSLITLSTGAITKAQVSRTTAPPSPLQLTASIGAASVRTEDRNEEILLNRADLALLDAKKAGKDRVTAAPL